MLEKHNFRKCFETILAAFSKLEIKTPRGEINEILAKRYTDDKTIDELLILLCEYKLKNFHVGLFC